MSPPKIIAMISHKCFDNKWVWLTPVWARLCILKPSLPGLDEPWWQYAKVTNDN